MLNDNSINAFSQHPSNEQVSLHLKEVIEYIEGSPSNKESVINQLDSLIILANKNKWELPLYFLEMTKSSLNTRST